MRLVDAPAAGKTGLLRLKQVKMTNKYLMKNINDALNREICVKKSILIEKLGIHVHQR